MVLLPTLVPVVGPAVGGILEPFATLSVMMACREIAAGRLPTIALFAAPFTDRLRRVELLRLGLLYGGLAILVALLFELLDPGPAPNAAPVAAPTPLAPSFRLVADVADPADPPAATAIPDTAPLPARAAPTPAAPPSGPEPTSPAEPAASVDRAPDHAEQRPNEPPTAPRRPLRIDLLVIEMLLLVPLIMARWFAPVLVGWHLMSPVKAMFFSFFACWRNRWPLLLWGGCILGIAALGSALLAFLAAMIGLAQTTASVLVAPWALAMVAYIQATVYPMYCSIIDDPL
jgi:hypothetical protein